MSSTTDNTNTSSTKLDDKSVKDKQEKFILQFLEEDDEFEEFNVESWDAVSSQEALQEANKLWRDDWNDDEINDEFVDNLRACINQAQQ